MKNLILGNNFVPLSVGYPAIDQIPTKFMMKTLKACFILPHVLLPFREQFQNESTPHILKYIQYQFGKFNNRKAIRYYYNKQPVRLAYSDLKNPFLSTFNASHPSYTKFPPLTANSSTARVLRELGLKWVVSQLFNTLNYCSFDEPELEQSP